MAKRPKKKRRSPEVARAKTKPSIVNWKLFLPQALVIVAAGLWIFRPVLHGDWLWDDDLLITQNKLVHDPSGLWKIWFEPTKLFDYFPITASVEWIEWHLWHTDTFGYHLVSLLLHLAGGLLVWRLFSKLGLRLAWLGGLIFVVHPAVVESVAWIAELKNTLSLPLFLGAMCAWIDYDKRKNRKDYFRALGWFAAAMLCKTTMVMFPVVILLYAWWKRSRVEWSDLKTSAPFFAISLMLGLVTIWFIHHHALSRNSIQLGGFLPRLALAGLSIAFYFSKVFLPIGLLPIYPKWIIDPPSPVQFLPWLVLGGVIGWLWMKRADWGRHVLLGLGFFLINLMPFIGFTTGSYMDFTWVMDHLLYLPLIGLIGLTIAGLGQLGEKLSPSGRPFAIGIVAAVMVLLAWESHGYAEMFVNQETLWTHTLQYEPDAWVAHINLGGMLAAKGRTSEAMAHFEQAVKLNPGYDKAHNNLGVTLMQTNRLPEAIAQFDQTLKINPDFVMAHYNLGIVMAKENRIPESIGEFEQALKFIPDNADAHYNLGNSFLQTKQLPEAREQFEQAIKINPDYANAHNNLGIVLMQTNRLPESIEQFQQAVKINPGYVEAHDNLGAALQQADRIPEAIEQYKFSLRINPDDAFAQKALAQFQSLQPTAPQIEPSAQ